MTFESQPPRPPSEKELLEQEKDSIIERLQYLDALDRNFLESKEVHLESEILLVKEKLADFGLAGEGTKTEYNPNDFSPIEQNAIDRLLQEKKRLIEEKKQVKSFLLGDKDKLQSALLEQLTDIIVKLKNL